MTNNDEQQMNVLADKIILDIKRDPFSYRNDIVIDNYTEEEFKLFENILMLKMPNLVIRHSEDESPEELSFLLSKVKDILSRGEQPYFIYLSKPKEKVKVKDN